MDDSESRASRAASTFFLARIAGHCHPRADRMDEYLPPAIDKERTLLEYVWTCSPATAGEFRSTMVCLDRPCRGAGSADRPPDPASLPQCEVEVSANVYIYLKPVRAYKDPFRGNNGCLVLCEVWLPGGAHSSNTRHEVADERAWSAQAPVVRVRQPFAVEPAPAVCDRKGGGGARAGSPPPVRELLDKALANCMYAGLVLRSAAVLPPGGGGAGTPPSGRPRMELEVESEGGLRAADDLAALRYIAARTAEDCGCRAAPPPPGGADDPECACRIMLSTAATRDPAGGLGALRRSAELLQRHHGSFAKLCGRQSTPVRVRISRITETQGCGFLEDRRAPGAMDPYKIVPHLLRAVCGGTADSRDDGNAHKNK